MSRVPVDQRDLRLAERLTPSAIVCRESRAGVGAGDHQMSLPCGDLSISDQSMPRTFHVKLSCSPASLMLRRSTRRSVQRRIDGQRPLQPVARLRPPAPADRAAQLRLGQHQFRRNVTTTLRALRSGFDSVVIDAGALLDIRSVVSAVAPGRRAAASMLRFDHVRDTLVVQLAHPAGFGDTVRFTVAYHARSRQRSGSHVHRGRQRSAPSSAAAVESGRGREQPLIWFPTYDFPNDKCTWELIGDGALRASPPSPTGG